MSHSRGRSLNGRCMLANCNELFSNLLLEISWARCHFGGETWHWRLTWWQRGLSPLKPLEDHTAAALGPRSIHQCQGCHLLCSNIWLHRIWASWGQFVHFHTFSRRFNGLGLSYWKTSVTAPAVVKHPTLVFCGVVSVNSSLVTGRRLFQMPQPTGKYV